MLVYVSDVETYFGLIDIKNNRYEVVDFFSNSTEDSSTSSESSRICYDSVPYMSLRFPVTLESLGRCFQRHAPRFLRSPELLQGLRSKIDIVSISHETILSSQEDLRFISIQQIVDWANTNLAHDENYLTETFRVSIYEDSDGKIPTLERGYGYNRAYAASVGSKNYRKAIHCGMAKWTAMVDVLFASWQEMNPSGTHLSFSKAREWYDKEGMSAVWCGKNDTRRYNLPNCKGAWESKIPITSSGQGGRRIACENFEGINSVTPDVYRLGSVRIAICHSWGHPPSYSLYDLDKEADRASVRSVLTQDAASSACAVYQVKGSRVSDNNFGLYLKPLGIDAVYTNFFDLEKYELEAVFTNDNRQGFFRKVDKSDILRQSAIRDMTMIGKGAWLASPFTATGIWRDGTKSKPWKVQFRLREKETQKVGSLTKWSIVDDRSGRAPIKFIVR